MTSPHMVEWVMDALRARADLVVIQCPPLLVPEPFTLALHADQLLVLVRCGRTTREQADAARETLADVAAERVGIVLTDARAPESNGSTLTGSRLLARIGSE